MKGTPLTEESYQYIIEHVAKNEEALLTRMLVSAKNEGVPEIMIAPDQAKFIAVFLRAIKAKRVLDVGTLFGYSAAIMSRAMGPKSTVVSLELNEVHARVAQQNWKETQLKNIELVLGDAVDSMKKLPSGSFDFILIDADKPNYLTYLEQSIRLVKNGGVIAGDNALAFGKITTKLETTDPDFENVAAVRAFNNAFSSHSSIFSGIVAVGDGMILGVVSK